jgi:hypothetical protein
VSVFLFGAPESLGDFASSSALRACSTGIFVITFIRNMPCSVSSNILVQADQGMSDRVIKIK